MFKEPVEFEWDGGNIDKNVKHGVSNSEIEEVFYDRNKRVLSDKLHSDIEPRYILVGQTNTLRILFIVFTIRTNKVRVISARDLNKNEKDLYEKRN